MSPTFIASLAEGSAVLRFPYDERLRLLLRAIPGRRWDAENRVWRIPLDPDRAEAITRLFATVPYTVEVSDALARALERRRAKRRPDECVLGLARADDSWWFSFATDNAAELVAALLQHPDAYSLPAIGRALIPLDPRAAELVCGLLDDGEGLCLTEDALHALEEIGQHKPAPAREEPPAWDVDLRRGRGGRDWIVIAAQCAPLARTLATAIGLTVLEGPGSCVGLAAADRDGVRIAALLTQLDAAAVDPRVEAWLERATTWNGTIEVDGPPDAPVFVLVGDAERLPAALRDRARAVPDGVSLPLTLESWQLIDEQPLQGWISRAAKRCVAAIVAGNPAPPAVLELSAVHDDPSFVLAPGHDTSLLDTFVGLPGVQAGKADKRVEHEHGRLPAIRVDPFCVPTLDSFIAD
ncbi:MAG: hypothetical protein ACRDLP_12010, partial [Solirubrobacteraceae bacterium]